MDYNKLRQISRIQKDGLGDILKLGASFLPIVGTGIMGYDAIQNAKQGNWGAAALNALGAGLGLIPGVGGILGKGVSKLGALLGGAGKGILGAAGKVLPKVGAAAAPIAAQLGKMPAIAAAAPAVKGLASAGKAALPGLIAGAKGLGKGMLRAAGPYLPYLRQMAAGLRGSQFGIWGPQLALHMFTAPDRRSYGGGYGMMPYPQQGGVPGMVTSSGAQIMEAPEL